MCTHTNPRFVEEYSCRVGFCGTTARLNDMFILCEFILCINAVSITFFHTLTNTQFLIPAILIIAKLKHTFLWVEMDTKYTYVHYGYIEKKKMFLFFVEIKLCRFVGNVVYSM